MTWGASHQKVPFRQIHECLKQWQGRGHVELDSLGVSLTIQTLPLVSKETQEQEGVRRSNFLTQCWQNKSRSDGFWLAHPRNDEIAGAEP